MRKIIQIWIILLAVVFVAPTPAADVAKLFAVPGEYIEEVGQDVAKKVASDLGRKYKQEFSGYAKDVGNAISEKIIENKQVKATYLLLLVFGAILLSYIFLVTVLLVIGLVRLNKRNKEILRLIAQRAHSPENGG